jgi:hypothetical protein
MHLASEPQVYEADGSRYEGELVAGQRHGTGRLSFASSPLVYEGQWRHGKRHGRGTLYYDAARTTYYQGGLCCLLKGCLFRAQSPA